MPGIPVMVGDDLFCYWDDAPNTTNSECLGFVNSDQYLNRSSRVWEIDGTPEYDDEVVDQIMMDYWLSLESAMTVLCSIVQAHTYFYGWILKSSARRVERVLSAIEAGDRSLYWSLPIDDLSWGSIFGYLFGPFEKRIPRIAEDSVRIAAVLSHELLDSEKREAFNRMKHGFGAKKNVIQEIAIDGRAFKPTGGQHGHQFLHATCVGTKRAGSEPDNTNFVLEERFARWDIAHCAMAIEFCGMLVQNLKAVLTLLQRGDQRIPLQVFGYNSESVEKFLSSSSAAVSVGKMRRRSVDLPVDFPTRGEIRKLFGERS